MPNPPDMREIFNAAVHRQLQTNQIQQTNNPHTGSSCRNAISNANYAPQINNTYSSVSQNNQHTNMYKISGKTSSSLSDVPSKVNNGRSFDEQCRVLPAVKVQKKFQVGFQAGEGTNKTCLVCKFCTKKLKSIGDLIKHVNSEHLSQGQSVEFHQSSKGKTEEPVKDISQNVIVKSEGVVLVSGIKKAKFACGLCMRPFTRKGNLQRHVKLKHSGNREAANMQLCMNGATDMNPQNSMSKPQSIMTSAVQSSKADSQANLFFTKEGDCVYGYEGSTHDQFFMQQISYSGRKRKRYACEFCMITTSNKGNLRRHMKIKHPNCVSRSLEPESSAEVGGHLGLVNRDMTSRIQSDALLTQQHATSSIMS